MTEDRLKLLIQKRQEEVKQDKYPVYCDIDNTIIMWGQARGEYKPNYQVIEALKYMHSTGLVEIVLWSGAGASHCKEIAELFGITDIVSAYLTKPVVMVDDISVEEFCTLIKPENI